MNPDLLLSTTRHAVLGDTRLECAVPGPYGELGYLLVVPKTDALEHDLMHDPGSTTRCWLEERQGWWVALPGLGDLASILERHGLISKLWLP